MVREYFAGQMEVSMIDSVNKGRNMVVDFKHGGLESLTLKILYKANNMMMDQ